MAYTTGGLIQASDYNGFATSLNTILSTGTGNSGYGQTTVSSVAAAGTVTATQWSTLVGAVNKVRSHQATFSNLGLYTSGTTINATTDVQTNINTAITNKLNHASNGVTITGSAFTLTVASAETTAAVTASVEKTATFGSSDQARYFFNAGGEIRYFLVSYTNTGGTVRGSTLGGLAENGLGGKTFSGETASARYGSLYTVTTDATTTAGYFDLTTGYVDQVKISGSLYGAAYSGDFARIQTKYSGATTNGAKGNIFHFNLTLSSSAQSPAFNDSINVTVNCRIDVTPPSATYLTDSWGTVTIA
tara:strand:+ start:4230 stop:5141 length:912 start_codon:yes stop_codon:yes gene_type:complete